MTRENKAGLVVASSFLILVGVVVAMKLRDPGEAPAPEVTPAMSVPTREKGPAVAALSEPKKVAEPPPKETQPPPPEGESELPPPPPGAGAGTSRGGAPASPDDKNEK